jgi:tetratricopeptide (TPR) repeat protein
MLSFTHTGDDIAMATRYTYLPLIAPGIAAAAWLTVAARRLRRDGRTLLAGVVIGCIVFCLAANIGVTLRLIRVWHDTGTFWSKVIEIEPVGRAFGDRGVFYLITGRSAEAVDDFSAAIVIAENTGLKSKYNLYAFRGVALGDIGRYAEAVADFDRAIEIHPRPTYFQQRGMALQSLGRVAEAADDFRRAGPNPPPIDWF